VRLQNLAQQLLFNWWPDVQLDGVQDNLATHCLGFSFLTHLANKIQGSYRAVHKLAFSEQGGCSLETRRGRARLKQYLNKCDSSFRLLYAGTHMTDGMPARGESLGYYAGPIQSPCDETFSSIKESLSLFLRTTKQTQTQTIPFTSCALPALWYKGFFTYTSYISARSEVSSTVVQRISSVSSPELEASHIA
jgi:hypothetical protein